MNFDEINEIYQRGRKVEYDLYKGMVEVEIENLKGRNRYLETSNKGRDELIRILKLKLVTLRGEKDAEIVSLREKLEEYTEKYNDE